WPGGRNAAPGAPTDRRIAARHLRPPAVGKRFPAGSATRQPSSGPPAAASERLLSVGPLLASGDSIHKDKFITAEKHLGQRRPNRPLPVRGSDRRTPDFFVNPLQAGLTGL